MILRSAGTRTSKQTTLALYSIHTVWILTLWNAVALINQADSLSHTRFTYSRKLPKIKVNHKKHSSLLRCHLWAMLSVMDWCSSPLSRLFEKRSSIWYRERLLITSWVFHSVTQPCYWSLCTACEDKWHHHVDAVNLRHADLWFPQIPVTAHL